MSLILVSTLPKNTLQLLQRTPDDNNCIVLIGDASKQLLTGEKIPVVECTNRYCVVEENFEEKTRQSVAHKDWPTIDMNELVRLTEKYSPIISL